MPAISVIIPVYNVEDFLPRALESVVKQTCDDFDVIVVDDGSTDNSGAICDEYARKYPYIKALHQINAGAPMARNAAIEIAAGDYLYFMDGDDWAEPEMLTEMLNLARKSGAELVVAGFYIDTYYSAERCLTQTISSADAAYDNSLTFRRAATDLFDKNLLYTPWNKLYLSARVRERGVRFKKTKWDDFPFNVDYIRDVERVAVTHKAYYHFTRARSESETAKYFPGMFDKRQEEHRMMVRLYTDWGLYDDPHAREFLARRYIERVFGVIENITCMNCEMSARGKISCIRDVITSEYIAWSLKYARPRSLMMKIMLVPIRLRSVYITYILGCVISMVRSKNSRLFARLKAGR